MYALFKDGKRISANYGNHETVFVLASDNNLTSGSLEFFPAVYTLSLKEGYTIEEVKE